MLRGLFSYGLMRDFYMCNILRLFNGFLFDLPAEVKTRILSGTVFSQEKREEIFNTLTEKFLKLNSEDPENFNRIVVHLDKTLDKKIKRPDRSRCTQKLTYRKRKELGLLSLGKKSLKYKELLPLHKLWVDYMTKYLNLEALSQQNWTNSPDDLNFEQVSLKLFRGDYHGAILTVLKSICPSYVGINGIVCMETKNCFKLLGPDNIVRIVPKASCLFVFKLQDFHFTFFGKNLQVRTAERSSKKVKTVYTTDLQL